MIPVPEASGEQTDEGLRSSRPPDGFDPVALWSLQTLAELRDLRGNLVDALQGEGPHEPRALGQVPHDMVLVASELAANALTHGKPPTEVVLSRRGDVFLLDVADRDVASRPHLADGREPGAGGFGLQIARRLSLDVAWYATDEAKHVWATFPAA